MTTDTRTKLLTIQGKHYKLHKNRILTIGFRHLVDTELWFSAEKTKYANKIASLEFFYTFNAKLQYFTIKPTLFHSDLMISTNWCLWMTHSEQVAKVYSLFLILLLCSICSCNSTWINNYFPVQTCFLLSSVLEQMVENLKVKGRYKHDFSWWKQRTTKTRHVTEKYVLISIWNTFSTN